MHCVAIDWSGAKAHGGRRDIALAECVDGRLVGIREGMSRGDVQRWLLRSAAEIPDLAVGLDFAFSLPAWFIREVLHASDVFGAWEVVAPEAEAWLAGAAPWPFWGRGAQVVSTNLSPDRAFRQTERDVAGITSTNPKSVFQLVGSGQVGPGSVRGIPMLRHLRAAGFAVWPFDGFGLPLVIEIYPRLLTGDVVKRDLDARTEFLARFADIDRDIAARAAATEHAFDAACSAVVMSRHSAEFEHMPTEAHPYGIEGKIWVPASSPADEAKQPASVAAPVRGSQRRAVPEVRAATKLDAGASPIVSGRGQPMVRVMRKHVSGFDDMPSDRLVERIKALEALLKNPERVALRPPAERELKACRRALEPDFANTKVHHASNCWYVDRYEEGRFPGGAKRRFVLVPAETVPANVRGCQYCESGRPAAVRLRQPKGANPPSLLAPGSAPRPEPTPGSVQLGSVVQVVDLASGEARAWQVASRTGGDPAPETISPASPIGKALLGHVAGDVVAITVPRGIRNLKSVEVSDGSTKSQGL